MHKETERVIQVQAKKSKDNAENASTEHPVDEDHRIEGSLVSGKPTGTSNELTIEEIAEPKHQRLKTAFIEFAVRHRSAENAKFLFDLHEIEKTLMIAHTQSNKPIEEIEKEEIYQRMFKAIYDKYVPDTALLQINVSAETRAILESENQGYSAPTATKTFFKLASFKALYKVIKIETETDFLKKFQDTRAFKSAHSLTLNEKHSSGEAKARMETGRISNANIDLTTQNTSLASGVSADASHHTTPSLYHPPLSTRRAHSQLLLQYGHEPQRSKKNNGARPSQTYLTQKQSLNQFLEAKRRVIAELVKNIETYLIKIAQYKNTDDNSSVCCCCFKSYKSDVYKNILRLKNFLKGFLKTLDEHSVKFVSEALTTALENHKQLVGKQEQDIVGLLSIAIEKFNSGVMMSVRGI